jgi:hypothetical protein
MMTAPPVETLGMYLCAVFATKTGKWAVEGSWAADAPLVLRLSRTVMLAFVAVDGCG